MDRPYIKRWKQYLTEQQPAGKFDEKMLIGKWVTDKTIFYRYDANHTGATWNTSEDVTEAEAQPFTWKLDMYGNLKQLHRMEMGPLVPKQYTINSLNKFNLIYTDQLNDNIIKFTKVL